MSKQLSSVNSSSMPHHRLANAVTNSTNLFKLTNTFNSKFQNSQKDRCNKQDLYTFSGRVINNIDPSKSFQQTSNDQLFPLNRNSQQLNQNNVLGLIAKSSDVRKFGMQQNDYSDKPQMIQKRSQGHPQVQMGRSCGSSLMGPNGKQGVDFIHHQSRLQYTKPINLKNNLKQSHFTQNDNTRMASPDVHPELNQSRYKNEYAVQIQDNLTFEIKNGQTDSASRQNIDYFDSLFDGMQQSSELSNKIQPQDINKTQSLKKRQISQLQQSIANAFKMQKGKLMASMLGLSQCFLTSAPSYAALLNIKDMASGLDPTPENLANGSYLKGLPFTGAEQQVITRYIQTQVEINQQFAGFIEKEMDNTAVGYALSAFKEEFAVFDFKLAACILIFPCISYLNLYFQWLVKEVNVYAGRKN